MFGDADLVSLFADFGVPVYFGGAKVSGILDSYTDVFSQGGGPGGFESGLLVLRLPYNAFNPMPKPMDAITVDGANYTVKALPKNQDASIVELHLKPAVS